MSGVFLLAFKRNRYFEYPFGKRGVYLSLIFSIVSIAFAAIVLIEEEPVRLSPTFMIPPLLLYFAFTAALTLAILAVKFYLLYREEEEMSQRYPSQGEGKPPRTHLKRNLIILLCLVIVALFSPLILSIFLDPLCWFITISGFVPAVSVPEIILYIYSRRRRSEKNES